VPEPTPENIAVVAAGNEVPRTPLLECRALERVSRSAKAICTCSRASISALYEGEIAGIVGASGAGKSTLLHLLGLLDTPNSGEILYRGRDLRALSAEAARACATTNSVLFPAFHLLNEFTALENVLMPARIGAGTSNGWPALRIMK